MRPFAANLLVGLLSVTAVTAAVPDDPAWAFRPPAAVAPPPVRDVSATRNPVDRFIQNRLEAEGLRPAPEADRATLLRRASFDLTGLPPTPEEMAALLADRRPDAFERVVDRLLASPRHGEHLARRWLDVARFGESQGFEYDRLRDNAWPYRDYVIGAFNRDLPYDRFVREQIAGDVLAPATRDGIAATGFLVAGPWDQAGNSSASASLRAAVREAELEDMVGTVGQTFLGLTLNCARCHDHKFDPVSSRDYYRVQAVFAGVRHGDRTYLGLDEVLGRAEAAARDEARLRAIDARLAAIRADARARAIAAKRPSVPVGAAPPPVAPLARWTFETDSADALGGLGGELKGGARVAGGRLVLDGVGAFLETPTIPFALTAKTLEVWVVPATLEQSGGGVLTVETESGRNFDSIVFGERQKGKWMAGSEFHRRSRDLDAAAETSVGAPVHVAVTYAADRTVTVYREGRPYGAPYVPADEFGRFNIFAAGAARVLVGRRHTGGADPFFHGEVEEARLYDRALTSEEICRSYRAGPDAVAVTAADIAAATTGGESAEADALARERASLMASRASREPAPMVYAANVSEPGPVFVLRRGEADKRGEAVGPGAIAALGPAGGDLGLAPDTPEAERRRRFADWIVSDRNPLAARVLVNRVWQHHFGRGLVATPNDFGRMGARPTHPGLLDWLAWWFVSPDGADRSLKRLHRLLVTSSTWRRGSGPPPPGDPDHALLSRFPPRRLTAEEVRDAMLAVAGRLNSHAGGPGFRAFTNAGNGFQNEYVPADIPGPVNDRRTVYRMAVHSARDPLLDALDCPEFSTRTPVRQGTTTPLQALSMMNNPLVRRMAAELASEVPAGETPRAAVERLWRRVLLRAPKPEERDRAIGLIRDHGAAEVAWALLNSNEFIHVR